MARKKRGLQEINAGSMADIAFLLLIFFLVTTTMDVDTGIARKLPPMPEEEQETPPEIHARNIYVVLVNAGDNLLVEGEPMNINQLKEGAKKFINNNGANPTLSDNPSEEINSVYMMSAPFSLQIALNGGSLTSSIGANIKGKLPKLIFSIFTLTSQN